MSVSIFIRLRFADETAVSGQMGCAVRGDRARPFQPLTLRSGAFEGPLDVALPLNGTSTFEISVHGQQFWDQTESFTLIFAFGKPLLIGGGGLALRQNVTGTIMTNIVITLDLAVSRLKDVTSTILPKIASGFQVFDFPPDMLTPMVVRPGASAPPFLNPTNVMINPWSLYFFQWIGGRSIIGVYVPASAIPITGKYIFFFKPPKNSGNTVKSVAEIYLTEAYMSYHQMLANCELARSRAVFCFQFAESGDPKVAANASVVSSILIETDRMLRAGRELSIGSGVRSVALASFSGGGELMNNTLAGLRGSRLSGWLKGIFVFDSWFGEGQLEVFRTRIRSWYANGADGKVLRVYQGYTVTDPDILPANAPHVSGPEGTVQKIVGDPMHPGYYYLKMTDAFLRSHAPGVVPPNDLHHAVPKLFLTHAIKTTVF